MTPFFSIVTPVLNGLPFLNTYFYSLRFQKFSNWEALVVDDGSSDSTLSELNKIASIDPRFRILCTPHTNETRSSLGPYNARNQGLSSAVGNYICFHDIDDVWIPSFLATYHDFLCSNPSTKFLCSPCIKANASLSSGYVKPALNFIPIKTQIHIWNPISMITACISSDMAKSVSFRPVNHEDYIYWHSVLSKLSSKEVYKLNTAIALYRTSPYSLSSNKFRVLSWWIHCYRLFGYPIILALALLSLKILCEIIEIVGVRFHFIKSFPIKYP